MLAFWPTAQRSLDSPLSNQWDLKHANLMTRQNYVLEGESSSKQAKKSNNLFLGLVNTMKRTKLSK